MPNKITRLKEDISIAIAAAASRVIGRKIDKIELSFTDNMNFGDFSCNLPFMLAGEARRAPREIASLIANELTKETLSGDVEVAGAGYLNIRLHPDILSRFIADIAGDVAMFSALNIGNSIKTQLEFVSANPTGPLNIVSGRAAAVGSALANIMRRAGYDVETEYYLNDAGVQIELLGKSFIARLKELDGEKCEIPEEGYHGEYLADYAKEYRRIGCDVPPEEWIVKRLKSQLKDTLDGFNTTFDHWRSERDLRRSGVVEQTLELLKPHCYESNGALWFAASRFNDAAEDFVVVKSDGAYSYGMVDIAYHYEKFVVRGFELVIDILGPDHHGHIGRMLAAARALGFDDGFKILTLQQVNLIERGKKVAMSKRAGKLVTLKELIDSVGVDVARFFFLFRKMEAHLNFDMELALKTSEENPVYYIQYAHARIANIIRFARSKEIMPEGIALGNVNISDNDELVLLRKMIRYPEAIEIAARSSEPHILSFYLTELAKLFHSFYRKNRVVDDDEVTTKRRLALSLAIKEIMRDGLELLGVSAPEQM